MTIQKHVRAIATQSAEAVPVTICDITPKSPGMAHFGGLIDSALFTADYNQYGVLGWNPGGCLAPEGGVLGVPSWAMAFENYFWNAGDSQLQQEWYLNYQSADQSAVTYFRPFYTNILYAPDADGKQRAQTQFNIGDSTLFPGFFRIFGGPSVTNNNLILEVSNTEFDIYRNFAFKDKTPGTYGGIMSFLKNDRYPTIAWYTGATQKVKMDGDIATGDFYLDATRDIIIRNNVTGGVNNLVIRNNGNIQFGPTAAGTTAVRVLTMAAGTAPTTFPGDAGQMCVKDQAAGNACFHFYTEQGQIIKLYQQDLLADPAAELAALASWAQSINSYLKNTGFMAAA